MTDHMFKIQESIERDKAMEFEQIENINTINDLGKKYADALKIAIEVLKIMSEGDCLECCNDSYAEDALEKIEERLCEK